MSKKNIIEILKKADHYSVEYNDIEAKVNGDFVKKLRKDLNMSQTVFASILGVTKKTIEKWEQGVNPVKGCSARLLFLIDKDHNLINQIHSFEFIKGEIKEFIVPVSADSNVKFSNRYSVFLDNNQQTNVLDNKDSLINKETNSILGLCC